MPEYALIDPVTGQQRTSTKTWLTRVLQLNCILLRENEHLGIITHRDLVLFARWCAGEMLARLEGEPHQSVVHALGLVDKWLEDVQSVTSEELEAAIRTVDRNASWVAWSVDVAAARCAARAIETIMRSTRTAVWRTAENAYAVGISFETQAQWLVEHLQSGK